MNIINIDHYYIRFQILYFFFYWRLCGRIFFFFFISKKVPPFARFVFSNARVPLSIFSVGPTFFWLPRRDEEKKGTFVFLLFLLRHFNFFFIRFGWAAATKCPKQQGVAPNSPNTPASSPLFHLIPFPLTKKKKLINTYIFLERVEKKKLRNKIDWRKSITMWQLCVSRTIRKYKRNNFIFIKNQRCSSNIE